MAQVGEKGGNPILKVDTLGRRRVSKGVRHPAENGAATHAFDARGPFFPWCYPDDAQMPTLPDMA